MKKSLLCEAYNVKFQAVVSSGVSVLDYIILRMFLIFCPPQQMGLKRQKTLLN